MEEEQVVIVAKEELLIGENRNRIYKDSGNVVLENIGIEEATDTLEESLSARSDVQSIKKTDSKYNIENISNWCKTGKQILDLKLDKVPTLLEPIMPKKGVISLAGSSDLGKSYFLLQLGIAIINGSDTFIGFKLNSVHKSVIYFSTEDDDYSLCPRLTKMSKYETDKDAYDNIRVVYETTDILTQLELLLKIQKADLVIIDTFSDIFSGDMNQSNIVRSYLQKFKTLANRFETLIIFNHHCGKKNDNKPPHKDNLLGSQGFESSMRTVFELRKDFTNPELRHLCVVKGNYLDKDFKEKSIVLNFDFEGDGFTNTGKRVRFEELVRSDIASTCERDAKVERIIELKKKGKSIRAITDLMVKEGYKISKTTIGDIVKKNCPSVPLPL